MFRLVTFDVYSALVDVVGGLTPIAARETGLSHEQARELVIRWRHRQLEYTLIATLMQRGHVSFETVTERALRTVAPSFGVRLEDAVIAQLVTSWGGVRLWPEAEPVLQELHRRGQALAVLSNGDEMMLSAFADGLSVPMQTIFAADQVGTYKPHPAIYRRPLEVLGLAGHEVLHVAGSGRDVMGAKAAGLACYWSNRAGEALLDPSLAADFEFSDLSGLRRVLDGGT